MKYTARPVTIEAIQFNGVNAADIIAAFGQRGLRFTAGPPPSITISTLEGAMLAPVGWWVIRGTAGELYPCAPAVFTHKYRPAAAGA